MDASENNSQQKVSEPQASRDQNNDFNQKQTRQWQPSKRGQIWQANQKPNGSFGFNDSKFNENAKPFKPNYSNQSFGSQDHQSFQPAHQRQQSHVPGLCAMIRHGERADNVPDPAALGVPIERQYDPPLTPLGVLQAQETGKFWQEYFKKHGYTQIIIESSPFLRSLQTAAETARILGIASVRVNYMLSEWLKSTFFTENPLDHLLIRAVSPEDQEKGVTLSDQRKRVVSNYLGGIDFVDDSMDESGDGKAAEDFRFVYKAYPERYNDMKYQRTKVLQNEMYWTLRNNRITNENQDQKIAYLYFGHGGMVKQFSQVLGKQLDNFDSSAGFCSITMMTVVNKRSRVDLDMDNDHITVKKSPANLANEIDISKLSNEEKIQFQLGYLDQKYKHKVKKEMDQVREEDENEDSEDDAN